MIYGLYQSAAGMLTHEYRQDVLANNLANAETVGFKREIAVLAERALAKDSGERSGPSNALLSGLSGGTWLGRTETDYSEGAFVATGNPTDVAIAGPGFLRVSKDGKEYLTRDGRMLVMPDGRLVSATDGASIMGFAGQELRVNPRGGKISIDTDGRIQQDQLQVGRLDVVDVKDYRALRKAGTGRFFADGIETFESEARIMGGHTESSGVEPIKELVNMLEATRAYQMNAQMVTLQDQSAGRLIGSVQ